LKADADRLGLAGVAN